MKMRFLIKKIMLVIGSLCYVTNCTKPEIAFVVKLLSRVTSKHGTNYQLAIE